jgi:Uncharacterised nucleotidyltransferase
MNRELAKTVIGCLRLKSDAPDVDRLRRLTKRDWQRSMLWLDHSGLTLYLLQRLHSLNATDVLPPPILRRFEGNLAQNRRRVDYLANQFAIINEGFQRAGVNFAVIKGFSLVPEFCPDASLRTQSDLDYLVDKQSLPLARGVLVKMGYCLQRVSDIEVKFRKLSSRIPTRSDDPYLRETEPLVELHLGFWKQKSTGIVLAEPEFRLDQTANHEWQGLRFPVLSKEDAFVLQVIHIFQHIIEGWVKLSWLLEIAYFLSTQSLDNSFWDRVDVRMGKVPLLSEFGAMVMGLARTIFAATVPRKAERWTRSLRVAARLWLDQYGRTWATEEHPFDTFGLFGTAKLCIFLQWEFIPDRHTRIEVTRRRLFPWKAPERVAPSDTKTAVTFLTVNRLQSQFVIRRLIFHLGSSLRFLWELPRWQELSRRAKAIPPPICTNPYQGVNSSPPCAGGVKSEPS